MSMEEIQQTTLADLEVLVRAYQLHRVDDMFIASYTAWQSAIAQGTDKKGKPIYRAFNDFFNYEKEMQKVQGDTARKVSAIDTAGLKLVAKANREV